MRFIGIDLGTTNTTCGVAELSTEGKITYLQLPIPQPQIDARTGSVSCNDSTILPSAVWLAEDNNVYTGAVCVEYADLISEHPGSRVVHGIKSELANRHWLLKHNDRNYGPAEISSCLLRTVWDAVCAKQFPEIDGIIITIPSSFSSTMRRETLRAAKMAGLPMNKVSLLDEPIAALFSEYGDAKAPFQKIQTQEPILVFDMGGGTVDVTVLKIRPSDCVLEVLATSRYNQVAGDDLDLEIAAYLWRRLKSLIKSPAPTLTRASALALLRAGEAVKLEVNTKIQSIQNGNVQQLCAVCRRKNDTLRATFDLPINVTEQKEMLIPIADVLELVLPFIAMEEVENNYGRNIFTPIQQALDSARLDSNTINQVYLVGGGANFQPVYLALRSFFHSLSRALNATFAVSAGAARFAAAALSGWRVSETTSERIYLRRNGESFLEVLPDKLPIPSQAMAPPWPLKDNDTIETEEESRYFCLEFFQGSQANDPQMSPVYTTTLRFQRPLRKGTFMDSLVGRIDRDKIYRFEIGLTEPAGRKLSRTVEFTADADAEIAPDSRPQYQLNNHVALATLLQSEPLRTRLSTRVGHPQVNFLPPAMPTVAEAKVAPMQSLLAERNALLQAMNEPWADAYIGDKYLPTRLRETMAHLQSIRLTPGAAPNEQQPHLELVELYKLYDVTVIRSLLDHSFLFYGTHNLEGKLGPVVAILTDDLNCHPERVQILLADLNQHAASAFEATRALVEIFLKAIRIIPGIYDLILNNGAFGAAFKLMAARLLGNQQDAPARLLKLLKQQLGNGLGRDEFDFKARPTIAALAQSGKNGFKTALDAFNQEELGHAGALVLGSFAKEFGNWAVEQETLPSRYVPALFQALPRIRERTLLDNLVFRLLDQWFFDPEVARKVNEGSEKLRRQNIYRNLAPKTQNLVDDLRLDGSIPDNNLIMKVREAAVKRDDVYLISLRCNEPLAAAIADVLARNHVDDAAAEFLLQWSMKENERFRRHLLGHLLRVGSFKKLNEARQRLILEWPVTKQMASVQMLDRILGDCKSALHPFVNKMIFEKGKAARQ